MKLEELVPSLELCKKIPAGGFADSAMVWMESALHGMRIFIRSKAVQDVLAEKYPAPMLQEIMVEIDNLGGWCPTAHRLQNQWTVDYQEDKVDGMNDVVEQTDTDNPATAALKLWLKLKEVTE